VKRIEPEDVAAAIVSAIEYPKFDVWVPRESAAFYRLFQLLPRRASEAVGRLMKIDKVLAEPDQGERAAYEQRAATVTPASSEPPEGDAAKDTEGSVAG
jgi:hypothetical protein